MTIPPSAATPQQDATTPAEAPLEEAREPAEAQILAAPADHTLRTAHILAAPADHTLCEAQWYVMRDLKRANAKLPAYKQLKEMGFEVFTPMKTEVRGTAGRRTVHAVPALADLLFVRSTREALDPTVARIATLQYRYAKGLPHRQPMTVRGAEMDRFIAVATIAAENCRYYSVDELTRSMIGQRVRIVGGAFSGMEGNLLSIRGQRKKRLLVALPDIIAASVIVEPEFIQVVAD